MTTLPMTQIGAELPALINRLVPGDEILLVDGDKPVARVTAVAADFPQGRLRGSAKGILTILAEDDDHLADFVEYM